VKLFDAYIENLHALSISIANDLEIRDYFIGVFREMEMRRLETSYEAIWFRK
jgi:hypothetical protein